MAKPREQWGSRAGFILAAIGSAMGLGNIWRFSYITFENGGGAFLIPYFFALLTAGIPLIILEFSVGHKYSGSAPATFAKINKKWEWLGWWQTLVAFVISIYYVVVIGWALNYCLYAFSLQWGSDPNAFFSNFIGSAGEQGTAFTTVGFQTPIIIGVLITWLINWGILFTGVRKGIEVANKFLMPILFVIVLIMVGRAITLPGAAEGLEWLFRPDFSKITDYSIWIDAYGQVFFTLSIAFSIMITYASYLPRDAELANNGFITAFINSGFSILAGITVFGILGYMASQQGVTIPDVVSSGVGLAFITFPQAINLLPGAELFGILFFLCITFAGLSSHISINETCIAALVDKYHWPRKKVVTIFCVIGFVISTFIFTRAGSGLITLDIVDHFINSFGIVAGGLIEVILLAWFFKLDSVQNYINKLSDFAVGNWWKICLTIITPIILGYMALSNLWKDIWEPYGGYSTLGLFVFGWLVLIAMLVAAILLSISKKAPKGEKI